MNEPLLTPQKVAEILDKPLSYVYDLIAPSTRKLPVVYIGPRSPRIRPADLEAFIASRVETPPAAAAAPLHVVPKEKL